jgi:hypothetical protein
VNVEKRPCILKICKRNVIKIIILQTTVLLLLAGLFFPGGRSWVFAGSPSPAVYCNGEALKFDVPPLFCQEIPVFPLRGIFEERGFTVMWEPSAKKVVLIGPGRVVYLYPGNPLFSVNGVVYRMARPPVIVQGRIMVAMGFLEQSADLEEMIWDEKGGVLHLKGSSEGAEGPGQAPLPGEDEVKKYDVSFIEVLLPAGEQAVAGENFKIIITAPFVQGIYAYAVRFSYNPEQIEVRELKNPSFNPRRDFSWKRIDSAAGMAEYLQTTLGYLEKIPPRDPLIVLEARALREGVLSLPGDALEVIMLDNTAAPMPAGLEEKTLWISSSP